jgi:hypothetical protein
MSVQTFKLVSPFEPLQRRSFDMEVPGILRATHARPIANGEWFQLTSTTYKMERGGDGVVTTPGTPDNEAAVPSYAFFGEPGRTEMQALGKGTFLFLGPYEADTLIFHAGAGLSIGQKLAVYDLDMGDGIVRRGLAPWSSGYIAGYVTRLPAYNNNWLRFRNV